MIPFIHVKYYFLRYLIFLLFLVTANIFAQIIPSLNESLNLEFDSSNLPLIVINTHGQTIQDEERIVAHMGVINNGEGNRNFLTDLYNDYDGLIAIELRGSSSSEYPKPQYRLETQDSLGDNLNISLLGLPKENDWILYGPYVDISLIRNVLSYELSNEIGRYASRAVLCELFVNDEYLGLYVLLEKLKRDKNRVSISKMDENDNTGDNLTGGYIIKMDKQDGESIEQWFSDFGIAYQYHYPKEDDITIEQKNYIQGFMNSFEQIMNKFNFNNPTNGYQQIIDLDSFVDHFIINEYCKNVDAFRISAFFYKDRDSENPKLFAGPIWDFNLTYGNAWFEQDIGQYEGWQVDYNLTHQNDFFQVPFWWIKIAHDFDFENRAKLRWTELRDSILNIDRIFDRIDFYTKYIEEARIRNFDKWPEVLTQFTYDEEISLLKNWIVNRIIWIDENIDNLTDVDVTTQINPVNYFILYQNYPNPFNPNTTIKYLISNVETLHTMSLQLKVYNILGREVATLVNEKQKPGYFEVGWKASGLPSGVYFYQLIAGDFVETKKMILLQ